MNIFYIREWCTLVFTVASVPYIQSFRKHFTERYILVYAYIRAGVSYMDREMLQLLHENNHILYIYIMRLMWGGAETSTRQ